eukprot:3087987-Lingulodinium_polyedra.AAC.1
MASGALGAASGGATVAGSGGQRRLPAGPYGRATCVWWLEELVPRVLRYYLDNQNIRYAKEDAQGGEDRFPPRAEDRRV